MSSKSNGEAKRVVIPAPRFETLTIGIVGVTPFVSNNFSEEARQQMKNKQEAGAQANKNRKKDPKDFMKCYEGAKHIAKEGWCGIPAAAFRRGMVDACRLVGFKMTLAKLCVFVEADGFDTIDGTPLVKITKGEPRYVEHYVRNEPGVADIRPRPMWDEGWEAIVRVTYDADQFTAKDVANLLARVGMQVGVGAGRPYSSNSCGMGWGIFAIKGDK